MTDIELLELINQNLDNMQIQNESLISGVLQISEQIISLSYILGVLVALLLVIIFALSWGCE